MENEDEEFFRNIKRFFRNFFLGASALLLISTAVFYYRYRTQRDIEDSFSFVDPKISFSSSYFYDIKKIFGGGPDGQYQAGHIEENINKLTEYDYNKVDELVSMLGENPVKDYYNLYDYRSINTATAKALGRMARKNKKAKDALCSIIMNPYVASVYDEGAAEYVAVSELRKLEPNLVFDIISGVKGGKQKTYLFDIITKDGKGNEKELKYFLKRFEKYLADFVISNHNKDFVRKYRNEIISRLYPRITCSDYMENMRSYAKAIWFVDPDYAKNELSQKIRNINCFDWWVHGWDTQRKGELLRAAHGR
ncbi:hypothetical protein HYZ41_02630 [archaeon]|nr:hypothetical protein [archaeon]